MPSGRHKKDCNCQTCQQKQKVKNYENGVKSEIGDIDKIIKDENNYIDLRKTLTRNINLSDDQKRNVEIARLKKDYKMLLSNIDEDRLYEMYKRMKTEKDEDENFPPEQKKVLTETVIERKKTGLFNQILSMDLEDKKMDEPLPKPKDSGVEHIEKEIDLAIAKEEEEKVILDEPFKPDEKDFEKAYEEHGELKKKYYKKYPPKRLAEIITNLQSRLVEKIITLEYSTKEKSSLNVAWELVVDIYLYDLASFIKYFPILIFILIQFDVNMSLLDRKKEKDEKDKKEKEEKEMEDEKKEDVKDESKMEQKPKTF